MQVLFYSTDKFQRSSKFQGVVDHFCIHCFERAVKSESCLGICCSGNAAKKSLRFFAHTQKNQQLMSVQWSFDVNWQSDPMSEQHALLQFTYVLQWTAKTTGCSMSFENLDCGAYREGGKFCRQYFVFRGWMSNMVTPTGWLRYELNLLRPKGKTIFCDCQSLGLEHVFINIA